MADADPLRDSAEGKGGSPRTGRGRGLLGSLGRAWVLWGLVLGWVTASDAASAERRLAAAMDRASDQVRVTFEGRLVMTYAFGADRFKPCVIQLATLEGIPVVRDAPADHVHHHGLMFAVHVNGVNFWEERGDAIGRQVSVAPPVWNHKSLRGGSERVVLQHRLRWEPSGSGRAEPLLEEDRRLVLTATPDRGELALEWESRLTPVGKARTARLHGTDYNGLGMRLPEGFDRVAQFTNADRRAYSEAQTRDVTETPWTAVTGRSEGRDVMVAMIGPWPREGAAAFFTMRQPFAYLAATQRLDQAPREIPSGKRITLRHLVLVGSAPWDHDALAARFAAWNR